MTRISILQNVHESRSNDVRALREHEPIHDHAGNRILSSSVFWEGEIGIWSPSEVSISQLGLIHRTQLLEFFLWKLGNTSSNPIWRHLEWLNSPNLLGVWLEESVENGWSEVLENPFLEVIWSYSILWLKGILIKLKSQLIPVINSPLSSLLVVWEVMVEGDMASHIPKESLGIGTSNNDSCTPETPSTFLFAYSNDLDSKSVKNSLDDIVMKLDYQQSKYKYLANIRFDTKKEEEITFSTDTKSFTASVTNNLPGPSLGFADDSTGSDVLNVIQNFLTNSQSPICGSIIFILLQRNPDDINISEIVSQLQFQHVFVRTVFMENLLGSSDSLVMYNISSKSNGLGVFTDEDSFDQSVDFSTNIILNEYLLYASNPIVSGQGQIELPLLTTPDYFSRTISVFVDITVQNHALSDDFHFLNLTLIDTDASSQSLVIDMNRIENFNGYYNTDIFLKRNQDFEVYLTYNYNSIDYQAVEIRMLIDQ
ncbi:hypothetical protein GCK72_013617 [Caenorhabditis remanei]|uniref:DUF7154 domain-containing protein n=1 Tax=Caenorhabditis remanei TaxID=31234 RepID=A0A6A5GS23_CAERE|nr:hypothetical protein GCK72_013617 [Caenorhabditis remanei]KAF1757162.1 hypothetical protein GCK72_013617 [Caenorhabditis remanei]